MSFCPLESYEQDWTRAECGFSGVLLMACLLPICDIRSRAQGNCQGREDCVTDSVSLCVCVYIYVWVERKGEKGQWGQNSYWRRYRGKQRLSKDELDMKRRKKTWRKWKGGWKGMGHLGGGSSDEKGIVFPGVKLSEWLGGICCPTFPLWPYIKPRGNKRQT